jgi:MoaD family protein
LQEGEEGMGEVKVLYLGMFSEITRRKQELVPLEKPTLGELIQRLREKYGREFSEALFEPGGEAIVPGVAVLVNGRQLPWNATLNSGDEVAFLVSYAGGGTWR